MATLGQGIGKIEKQLARAVEKGKARQDDADAVRGRIEGTTDYGALADCDLVIEAITEDLGLKLEMWTAGRRGRQARAFFATNTSSLPVIAQAASTSRPERFLGLHFFNPVQVMKLLEVVKCVTTSDEAHRGRARVRAALGQADGPDQGQGRLHRQPAARSLHARWDAGARGGRRLDHRDRRRDEGRRRSPDGSADACDFVGLDTLGSICDVLFDEFRERRFAQPPTLRKMLAAGWYGRKSGHGLLRLLRRAAGGEPGLA